MGRKGKERELEERRQEEPAVDLDRLGHGVIDAAIEVHRRFRAVQFSKFRAAVAVGVTPATAD